MILKKIHDLSYGFTVPYKRHILKAFPAEENHYYSENDKNISFLITSAFYHRVEVKQVHYMTHLLICGYTVL